MPDLKEGFASIFYCSNENGQSVIFFNMDNYLVLKSYTLLASCVIALLALFGVTHLSSYVIAFGIIIHLLAFAYLHFYFDTYAQTAKKDNLFGGHGLSARSGQRYSGFGISALKPEITPLFESGSSVVKDFNSQNIGKQFEEKSDKDRKLHKAIRPVHLNTIDFLGFGKPAPKTKQYVPPPVVIEPEDLAMRRQEQLERQQRALLTLDSRVPQALKIFRLNLRKYESNVDAARRFMAHQLAQQFNEEKKRIMSLNSLLMAAFQRTLAEYSIIDSQSDRDRLSLDQLRFYLKTLTKDKVLPPQLKCREGFSIKDVLELQKAAQGKFLTDRLLEVLKQPNCSRLYLLQRILAILDYRHYMFASSRNKCSDNELILALFLIATRQKSTESLSGFLLKMCPEYYCYKDKPKECFAVKKYYADYVDFEFYGSLISKDSTIPGFSGQRNAYSMIAYYFHWLNATSPSGLNSKDNPYLFKALRQIVQE